MESNILHLDLDTFFVSCERRMDSKLLKRPVLVGGTGNRGVVSACSYETRKFGVRSGMAMKLAKQLCPEAYVIRGNASTYTKFSQEVTDIIKEQVPLFEKASVDEFYADLSGMDKFFGCYKYATELRHRIMKETGLPISFGLSSNKITSKVATNEAKPNNQMKIEFGLEKSFLAPLSVHKIPSIGKKTFQSLKNMGVFKVKTIQDMPEEMMISAFGKNGQVIWRRANGMDRPPLIQYHERKSISTERTFWNTTDMVKLRTTLTAMAENLGFALRNGDKLTSCISIKIRYADFNTYTKQVKIPYTSADHILIPKVLELFEQLYQRRLLLRLVGVRMSDLVSGNYQINLFDDTEEMLNLYGAMDHIRRRFGEKTVMRASSMGAKSIGRFYNAFNGEPPMVLAHRTQ
ncbi:DNA polymerase IV [Cytophaga sp. FL35]|uniref:DNA polymerase IV n=1 Tax=Cytophaga sp. FL35 TaxID=1904456 RepID=UPI000C6A6805|nr:DNA polymerase IV [Cytophaga sp. FL35]MAU70543.1 DNA polymerase IV [Pseudozobellia sp.]MBC7000784.1 DNA polymerase IV [Cytophaga sp. FL35]MBG48031.1 DNA polymerase IV [Pseudozobellia sp.]|tara:strand:- start:147 stop:1358 length:1212 start_codon:yes stop_codon:yes gene_type:complete